VRRALVTLLVGALGALVGLAVDPRPAAAKEGVVARVLTPIPRDSQAGTKLTAVWTLSFVEDGKRRPFGGGDVFIRLFGPDGSRSRRVYAEPVRPGRYRARVGVPRGGVTRIVIGLMGILCDGDQNGCRPSPKLFPIAGDPFR
jgi:hypothetical protein